MDALAMRLYNDAMKLSPLEREELAVSLMGSIDSTAKEICDQKTDTEVRLSEAWDGEIAKRIEEIQNGTVELVSEEEVKKSLRKIVNGDA